MNKATTLACALLIGSLASAETPEETSPVEVQPNQAVIQVNGIVCSFCAYGTEKNLRKLTFLDKSQFGDDGVLIDIHSHRITLALQPEAPVDLPSIYNAIKKGGYDPVNVYLSVHGHVRKDGDRYLLTCPENGQQFALSGDDVGSLVDKGLIEVKGAIDAAIIPDFTFGQAVPLEVLKQGLIL